MSKVGKKCKICRRRFYRKSDLDSSGRCRNCKGEPYPRKFSKGTVTGRGGNLIQFPFNQPIFPTPIPQELTEVKPKKEKDE